MNVQGLGLGNSGASNNSSALNPQGLGKDDFLKLLVAQLSHQDPLNPQEGAEFVAQLAQFSSLEQIKQVNSGLETIAAGQAGIIAGQSVQLVGKQIQYPSSMLHLEGPGEMPIRYELAAPAADSKVEILDAHGEPVLTLPGEKGQGTHDTVWNGKDAKGNELPPGDYKLRVTAIDEDGNPIEVKTYGVGRVDGITYVQGYPELLVGQARVQLTDILQVMN